MKLGELMDEWATGKLKAHWRLKREVATLLGRTGKSGLV